MAGNKLNHRERVLATLRGEKVDPVPVFSGMGNLTVHGLADFGWRFPEIHVDGHKMAAMAASTYKLFGLESVVVPFDMGVEAEALGCGINYYEDADQILYPTISKKVADKVDEWDLRLPDRPLEKGRIPVVVGAIKELKDTLGAEVAVGAWVLGPYTLAGQLFELDDLFKKSSKKPDAVHKALDVLEDFLIDLAALYREAGADYMTVREMGASGDNLSPRMFSSLIQPHLRRVFAALDSPKILHICGDTNLIIEQMADCGADAVSVDQKNNLRETRRKVGDDVILLGNLDPYKVLVTGSPEHIDEVVKEIIDSGVNAVWPGCDIWPDVPRENMKTLVEATHKYGQESALAIDPLGREVKRITANSGSKGSVIVLTGGGKGKTTAALGLACRMVGHGGRATFIYFSGPARPVLGEVQAAKVLGSNMTMIAVQSQAADQSYLEEFDESVPTLEAALERVGQLLRGPECSLLVLDDINPLLDCGAIDQQRVRELMGMKSESTTIVLTCRAAPYWLVEMADMVTEFAEVKHPVHDGVPPRKGIEF